MARRMRNTSDGYGLVARLLHWSMAAAIFAMFALGWWMVGLTYYSEWYKTAPDIHRSVGMILLLLLVLRLVWRWRGPEPDHGDISEFERRASTAVHRLFYLLLFAVMIAGYLISTADGRPIEIFGLVSVPAVYENKGMEDVAGLVHEYLAYAIMALALLHGAAAIKHHVIDGDRTLLKMLKGPRPEQS